MNIVVFVVGATRGPLCIQLNEFCYGKVVYDTIQRDYHVPVDLQLLLHLGKSVKRILPLCHQGIKNGATIFFSIKGIGGGGGSDSNLLG